MKIVRDESGQTIVLFAVFMGLCAIGFLAIALDAGLLFREKWMAQAAADAVAVAAAEEVVLGQSTTEENTVAAAVAKINGFDNSLATNPATVVVQSVSWNGATYQQATVSEPIPTYFLAAMIHGQSTVTVGATSIAGGTGSATCVCLTGTSGQDLLMSNGSSLTAPSCGVVDNSSSSNALSVQGGATLSALTLGTVSNDWDNTSNITNGGTITSSTKIIQGISSACNPTMPTPPSYSTCLADPGSSGGNPIDGPSSPGGTICYNGLTLGANGGQGTLNPGIYVINGGYLTFDYGVNNVSNLGGNGVFFYLMGNSSLVIQNGANVNLTAGGAKEASGATAPSNGAYDGILIYQQSGSTGSISAQGGSKTFMNGSILAPSAAVTIGNGSGSTVEGSFVAKTLNMSGGGTLTANTSTNEGSLAVGAAKLVQ